MGRRGGLITVLLSQTIQNDCQLHTLEYGTSSIKQFLPTVLDYQNGQYSLSGISKCLETKSTISLPSVAPIGAPWQQIYLFARKQKKIYVEFFELAPINLSISFSSTPWMVRNETRAETKTFIRVEDNTKYLQSGPPFLILLHPALGPLWEITRQKFFGGSIMEGSELQIEVAEFMWREVQLDGSLLVIAENIMGSTQAIENGEPLMQYGHRCARCKLQNVKVQNKGIDWTSADNVYWMHNVHLFESLKVILQGNAEFEATDVVLQGNHVLEVPNGHRMHVSSGDLGFVVKLEPIKEEMMDSGSWFWKYKLNGTHIQLELVEL
ncbi:UTP--glucose-1-phosphate uridylyltransferase 3, chloroplastic-like isoform X2 [Dioscorea cayenensis subsp. rotundata]|uniref:UTP--glucose-1-phosphate uridylyltransferase 3, chloroplastic-like isoform X2 n=1 Tax=Dioscorea cayennensis subsp. rotundata TaxID=55577 RepID=A0AB40CZL8_DIOCR|nr:UTP--glucose-1-phosphate uridylyltransferase 3, chloroplastic-like isoform X2 [Dioscorea cayenensis subsp. rotundata]